MKIHIVCLLCFGIAVSGCNLMMYTPSNVQIPMHKNQGEISFSGHLNALGHYYEGSYALLPNVAVMANMLDYRFYKDHDPNKFLHKEQNFDVALGYFNANSAKPNKIFEVYAGYGKGNVYDNIGSFSEKHPYNYSNYNKYFVQFDIGYRVENFEFAFANRISSVSLSNLRIGEKTIPSINCTYIEPSAIAKMGSRNFKLIYQLGFSALRSQDTVYTTFQSGREESIDFMPLYVSFSIGIEIQLYRDKK